MRIRTGLQAAVAAALVVALAALVTAGLVARAERRDAQTFESTQTIAHEVTGLLVLTQEYALHGDKRAAHQWLERQRAIAEALGSASGRFAGNPAFDELLALTRALPALFERLQSLPGPAPGAAADATSSFDARRREVLLDQVLANAQAMSDHAHQWYRQAARQREQTGRLLRALAVATPLIGVALVLSLALLVGLRVLRPLARLGDATRAFAAGDLSARAASGASDEIGDLGRELDRMARSLDERTHALARSERRLAELTNRMPALVGFFDTRERCVYANETVLKLHRLTLAQALGRTLRFGIGDESYALHEPYVKRVLQGEPQQFEGHLVRRGRDVYFQAHLEPASADDGSVAGFYLMTFDVTALRLAERERARSELRLKRIADHLPALVACIDRQHRFTFANEAYRQWFGLDPARLAGRPFAESMGEATYRARLPHFQRVLAGERVDFEAQVDALGITRSVAITYVPDLDPGGQVVGLYALAVDVSPLKVVQRQLAALARHDALTGLPNRLSFDEKLAEALQRAQRSGGGLALMYLDVDNFKAINDALGHAAGDAVLQEFARRLGSSVRATDLLARLAGDEFVVILENLRSDAEPQFVARKIVAQVARPFELDGRPITLTTSVGVAWHDPLASRTTPQRLMAQADRALYQAKHAGRNAYRLLAQEAS